MEFTPRQLEVLKLVAQGYHDPQIAERLRWPRPTVSRMLRELIRQLDATSLPDFRRKAGAIDESAPSVVADSHLTERDAQILHLLTTGHTNQQIGEQLHLTITTIRSQLNQIYRKLGVTTRSQAAVRAIELGVDGRTC